MNISNLIVEVFEKENPSLCAAIKLAVASGETKSGFETFLKRVIPKHEMTTTYPLSLTLFDHYKKQKK